MTTPRSVCKLATLRACRCQVHGCGMPQSCGLKVVPQSCDLTVMPQSCELTVVILTACIEAAAAAVTDLTTSSNAACLVCSVC